MGFELVDLGQKVAFEIQELLVFDVDLSGQTVLQVDPDFIVHFVFILQRFLVTQMDREVSTALKAHGVSASHRVQVPFVALFDDGILILLAFGVVQSLSDEGNLLGPLDVHPLLQVEGLKRSFRDPLFDDDEYGIIVPEALR